MGEIAGFTVDLSDWHRLAKKFPLAFNTEAFAVVDQIVSRLEDEVVSRTPEGAGAGGGLAGSIIGDTFIWGSVVKGIVGTPLEYGLPVEKGTRPHFPPAGPIILWAARKLGLSGNELRRAVRAIQWKIYRHGTEGAHMFEKGYKATEGWAMQMLGTIPERVKRRVSE